MARYDYKCSKCEHVFEVQHSIHDEPKIKCEKENVILFVKDKLALELIYMELLGLIGILILLKFLHQ